MRSTLAICSATWAAFVVSRYDNAHRLGQRVELVVDYLFDFQQRVGHGV